MSWNTDPILAALKGIARENCNDGVGGHQLRAVFGMHYKTKLAYLIESGDVIFYPRKRIDGVAIDEFISIPSMSE